MGLAARGLVAAYVLLLPVRWSPFPANLQWSEIVFLALLVWCATRGYLPLRPLHPLDLLVIGYLLGGLTSLVATSDVGHSLLQYAKHLYLGLVYYVFSRLGADREGRGRIIAWLATAAGILAASALAAVVLHGLLGVRTPLLGAPHALPYVGSVARIYGPFLSPAYFASFMTFAFPLVLVSLHRATSRRTRLAWACVGAMAVVADVLTLTYSLVGLWVAGLCYAWPWFRGRGPRMLRAALVLVTIGGVLALNAMLVVSIRELRVDRGRDPAASAPGYTHAFPPRDGTPTLTVAVSYNVMSYWLLKQIAWEAFQRKPWTGIGLGEFHTATTRAYEAGTIHARHRAVDPHSTWLGRLAETGIIGGAGLAMLWGGVLSFALRAGSEAGEAARGAGEAAWPRRALVAGIVGLLVNSINLDIMNFRFVWLGLALLRGVLPEPADSPRGAVGISQHGGPSHGPPMPADARGTTAKPWRASGMLRQAPSLPAE